MSDTTVLQIAQSAILLALQISMPLLGISLAVGLAVSIVQAATQIQESSLSFIPKLLAMVGALLFFGPWMLHVTIEFTRNLLIDLPTFIK
jgi:flagellar biosynthesis protein FliQ